MAKVTPITEQFQYFVSELKESFWGDLQGQVQHSMRRLLELLSERQRDLYMVSPRHSRQKPRQDYRNGYYQRDFVTRFGTLRLRIARTRKRGFLPAVLHKFQRRAEEVSLLIREAFLRGISTRQVGRLVAILTGEAVSPQTVSRLTRDLDEAVRQFHQAPLQDEWAYLFLDGVSLRMRRPSGRQRVHMLVAYGVRADGTRQLLAFMRSQGESQSAWEGLLQDLYRRGLHGEKLLLIVTDGCPGLAAAIETVYPRALHQRCWVHKMRNILEKVRRRDHDAVKADAQAIYRADSRRQAETAFRRRWQPLYGSMVRQLERDLPQLLSFFSFPRHLWKRLRTTNIIERCFVEVRRRTRPMVCFVNVKSVDRIIYSIFQRFNLEWKTLTTRKSAVRVVGTKFVTWSGR
jgi:putative transposase